MGRRPPTGVRGLPEWTSTRTWTTTRSGSASCCSAPPRPGADVAVPAAPKTAENPPRICAQGAWGTAGGWPFVGETTPGANSGPAPRRAARPANRFSRAGRSVPPPYGLAGGYHRHTPATAVGSPAWIAAAACPTDRPGVGTDLAHPRIGSPGRPSRPLRPADCPPVGRVFVSGPPRWRGKESLSHPSLVPYGHGSETPRREYLSVRAKLCLTPWSIRRATGLKRRVRSTFSPARLACGMIATR